MTYLPHAAATFIAHLDAAVEAHMEWTHRVLRCAVLRAPIDEDVFSPVAHTCCQFGRWFVANRVYFEDIDPASTDRLEATHQAMHDSIRSICSDVLADQLGKPEDLEVFEQTQSELIRLLAEFKTKFLSDAMRYDPLTGLPERHGIELEFLQIQKNCKRNNTLLYAAMIDVDHFKRINDHYGHPVGDTVLRHLACTMKRCVRPDEPLYRFGGEEFLLLMQCQNHEAATLPTQRLIDTVRSSPVPIPEGAPLTLTVTMGLARAREGESIDSLIERADRALYQGKRAGRDRYVFVDD